MSYQNFNPKLYQSDDIQFKIVTRSQQEPLNEAHQQVPPKNQKIKQIVMNDSSDIFNDGMEGGGVDPSINESIRQSIQYSFVSSDCNETKQQYQQMQSKDNLRNTYVMNRMNWITYLKVLFDQLESFNQNKQKHVETANFLKGFKKIKNLLPLQARNDYYKNCSEVAFTYKDVEKGVTNMPQHITWDNVIDIFLAKSFAAAAVTNPNRQVQAFQQLSSQDLYQQPQQLDESQISVYYDEVADVNQNTQDRYSDHNHKNKKQNQVFSMNTNGSNHFIHKQKNDDICLSFADNLFRSNPNLDQQKQQHILAQAPLTLGNPNIGLQDKDDDEACEIDSEYSEEESKNDSHRKRQKSQLEESIRSSRTATFKSVRRLSSHHQTNQGQSLQSNKIAGALAQAVNVQDSYYQTIKNSSMPQNFQAQQNQKQVYYQKQQSFNAKNNESRNSSTHFIDNEDGQVEVDSNRSYGSQKWRNHENNSIRVDILKNEESHMNMEKSTRLSSLNSLQKNHIMNQNNTILSQESSQSSQSYKKHQNNSKISSAGQNSLQTIQSSNYVDLDFSGKNLKNSEIDYKTSIADKRLLRSINFAINHLVKLPPGLEKSLQYLNVSYNKLKSLNGIESCVNLKFLNVAGNQLSSGNNLVLLQSMRELIFSHNQLSLLKEIGQLKNLQLLDLSCNKLIEFEKLIPIQNLKKLTILALQGNLLHQIVNYETVLKRMLPTVKVLDPDSIRDFSQFSGMEHICFTEAPTNEDNSQFVIVDQLSQLNLRQFNVQENQNLVKPRSRTPNRDRTPSKLDHQAEYKLKSTIISPQRETFEIKTCNQNSNQKAQHKAPFTTSNKSIHESKLKIQSKYAAKAENKGGQSQRLSYGPKTQVRERSYTNEQVKTQDNKSQVRERSISNISRNKHHQFNTVASLSVRSGAPSSVQSMPLQHQQTNQSLKENPVKKIGVTSNLVKTYASQGKITPRRNNVQTPSKEKVTNYYKKSFCTEEESSMIQNINDNEKHGTPSEKNTMRTLNTQDSSHKKKDIRNVQKKDDVSIHNAKVGILSPQAKIEKASISERNSHRPSTTLKQRAGFGLNQMGTNDQVLREYQNNTVLSTYGQKVIPGKQCIPQSTKNTSNNSQSFVFDHQPHTVGRQTPTSQLASNRPSSQLQKFITATKQSSQSSIQSSRPSTSSAMKINAIPSQRLTNLPPRAYQSKVSNPGDKKSKADMSLSIVSSQGTPKNAMSNYLPQPIKGSTLQTGGTYTEEESRIESISSRSMSPVLEESNNIKKLKVDLTQFMNKQ